MRDTLNWVVHCDAFKKDPNNVSMNVGRNGKTWKSKTMSVSRVNYLNLIFEEYSHFLYRLWRQNTGYDIVRLSRFSKNPRYFLQNASGQMGTSVKQVLNCYSNNRIPNEFKKGEIFFHQENLEKRLEEKSLNPKKKDNIEIFKVDYLFISEQFSLYLQKNKLEIEEVKKNEILDDLFRYSVMIYYSKKVEKSSSTVPISSIGSTSLSVSSCFSEMRIQNYMEEKIVKYVRIRDNICDNMLILMNKIKVLDSFLTLISKTNLEKIKEIIYPPTLRIQKFSCSSISELVILDYKKKILRVFYTTTPIPKILKTSEIHYDVKVEIILRSMIEYSLNFLGKNEGEIHSFLKLNALDFVNSFTNANPSYPQTGKRTTFKKSLHLVEGELNQCIEKLNIGTELENIKKMKEKRKIPEILKAPQFKFELHSISLQNNAKIKLEGYEWMNTDSYRKQNELKKIMNETNAPLNEKVNYFFFFFSLSLNQKNNSLFI